MTSIYGSETELVADLRRGIKSEEKFKLVLKDQLSSRGFREFLCTVVARDPSPIGGKVYLLLWTRNTS